MLCRLPSDMQHVASLQHDDRDVVTFKEELRGSRNGGPGGTPGQPAAGGGGRGPANAGGSFIVEDPG